MMTVNEIEIDGHKIFVLHDTQTTAEWRCRSREEAATIVTLANIIDWMEDWLETSSATEDWRVRVLEPYVLLMEMDIQEDSNWELAENNIDLIMMPKAIRAFADRMQDKQMEWVREHSELKF